MTIVEWKLYRKVKVCAYLDYVLCLDIYLPSGKMRNGNLVINAMQRNGHCKTFVSNHKWIIRRWSALNAFRSIICHCWWVNGLVNNQLRWIIDYKIAYNGLQLSLSSWFYKNDILTLACLTYFLIKIY